MRGILDARALPAQALELLLQLLQFVDACADVPDVRVQQRVHVAAGRVGGVLEAQQHPDLL